MGALKCTITMDKTVGVVIQVEDADAQAKQTISLLKDSIVITVAGAAATSVVTQTADSVSIKCKSFSIEADDVTCTSRMTSTFKANTEMKISGTNAVSVDGMTAKFSGTTVSVIAQGALNAEATGPATLKGSVANVTAPVVMLG
jgi:phage baseplate assembly protein gpV